MIPHTEQHRHHLGRQCRWVVTRIMLVNGLGLVIAAALYIVGVK